jgi:hypothetical protein
MLDAGPRRGAGIRCRERLPATRGATQHTSRRNSNQPEKIGTCAENGTDLTREYR